jgi:hypothetical protein
VTGPSTASLRQGLSSSSPRPPSLRRGHSTLSYTPPSQSAPPPPASSTNANRSSTPPPSSLTSPLDEAFALGLLTPPSPQVATPSITGATPSTPLSVVTAPAITPPSHNRRASISLSSPPASVASSKKAINESEDEAFNLATFIRQKASRTKKDIEQAIKSSTLRKKRTSKSFTTPVCFYF